MTPPPPLERIISGGQTGVDRGALDAALELGFPHGGLCPAGRRAEDGRIPDRYRLEEASSPDYASRTEANVLASDATLILSPMPLSGGTALTAELARRHGRPLRTVDAGDPPSVQDLQRWIRRHGVRVLNVAGPRESGWPGAAARARELIRALLAGEGPGALSG